MLMTTLFAGICCSAIAETVKTMIVGRLLAGLGIGISSALVPLYISEVTWFLRTLIGLFYSDSKIYSYTVFVFADITN